jgi:hypothetical protein
MQRDDRSIVGRDKMQPKFPIWLLVISILQILASFALGALLVIIGSAFGGETSLSLLQAAVLGLILAIPLFCLWLARKQWQAGRSKLAILTALAPIWLFLLIGALLELGAGLISR